MARPKEETSNSLLDTLVEWNAYLAQDAHQLGSHQAL